MLTTERWTTVAAGSVVAFQILRHENSENPDYSADEVALRLQPNLSLLNVLSVVSWKPAAASAERAVHSIGRAIVCRAVVSCNAAAHFSWALLPALPTWRSCRRHGSAPWQAHFPPRGGTTERRDCANSSRYRFCPLFGGRWGLLHLLRTLHMSPRFVAASQHR